MARMNKEGLAEFRADERLACLVPYFDAVRLPDANAWTVNLLICENKEYNRDEVAVGLHLDQSIAIDSMWLHLAHEVNVLYVSIPDAMEGGELKVWSYNHTTLALVGEDAQVLTDAVPPDEVVQPVENTMVAFRGDSWHLVQGYKAPRGGRRISLVVEQYKKSERDYKYTHGFSLRVKNNMEMM